MGYGGPQVGQWTPMDSPTCPMVQLDRTDSGIWGSSGGIVDSHGQSHLSHGSGIGQWGMVVLRWDSGLPWTVPPVPW